MLEPLSGYLLLAQRLYSHGQDAASGWNFGPSENDTRPVAEVVERLARLWGGGARWQLAAGAHPYEARHLKLDCSKARAHLGWIPRTSLDEGLAWTAEWYRAWHAGEDVARATESQIERYFALTSS